MHSKVMSAFKQCGRGSMHIKYRVEVAQANLSQDSAPQLTPTCVIAFFVLNSHISHIIRRNRDINKYSLLSD